jgi:KDO2-lipid IV(A) lauroyltransferase
LGERLRQSASDRARGLRKSISHAGLIAAELPKIWCDSTSAAQLHIEGIGPINALIAQGRGIVFLTPHLGAFELSPRAFAKYHPITVLYRPARQAVFRRLMQRLRPMPGLSTAPATGAGVRQLLRALKKGQAVGMLPDQVPSQGEGVWADFFGKPAYTMTLPIRLAQTTGAAIVWALTTRTRQGWRLDLSVWDCPQEVIDGPVDQAVQAMNTALEAQIARAPEQYLWAYNRYKQPKHAPAPAMTGLVDNVGEPS